MEKSFIEFEDLERRGIADKSGCIRTDNPQVQFVRGYVQDVDIYSIENIPYYVKKWRKEQSVQSIASAEMYANLGVATPPVYVLKTEKKLTNSSNLATANQDVTSATGLVCKLGKEVLQNSGLFKRCFGKFKWEMLYNSDLRQQLLQIMTPECLEEVLICCTLAEIRTDCDGHILNYFFVKSPEAERWEHYIPIDLEMARIQCHEKTHTKDGFSNFIYINYASALPYSFMQDNLPYITRVREVGMVIDDGVLSPKVVNVIKQALQYDFPKLIYKTASRVGEKKIAPKQRDTFERLWELNRKELGGIIGL